MTDLTYPLTYPTRLTNRIDELVQQAPVIPVLTIKRLEDAVPLAHALVEGGLSVLEVTLRSDVALEAIAAIAAQVPDAEVGAGTVLNPDDFDRAVDAGSRFIVSPGMTSALLDHGCRASVPLLPGIQTVSELMTGIQRGYQRFKFFPAEVAGGVAALKAIAGPFANVRFCPTGGIRAHTAADYLALPNVMCVGGTWLAPDDLIKQGHWDAIRELARASSTSIVNRP